MTTIQDLVEQDFGYKPGRGIWGKSIKHSSLVVNEKTQEWFWNSKDLKGDVYDYLILVRGMNKSDALKIARESSGFTFSKKVTDISSPPYEKLVELMWSNGKTNRDYWYRRCLKDNTIDQFKLGFSDGWYLIPIFLNGNFRNFQCRRDEPEKRITQWYRGVPYSLFNSGILKFVKKIFITEGPVDAMLLTQEGFPAVSIMGNNMWDREWYELFIGIPEIYYIEDNDVAGRIASKTVSKNLGLDRVKIVSFLGEAEKFDTVDFFRKGKTSVDFAEYVERNSKFIYEMGK